MGSGGLHGLQNRWSASLAMSTDGSFPSRPRQFLNTNLPPRQSSNRRDLGRFRRLKRGLTATLTATEFWWAPKPAAEGVKRRRRSPKTSSQSRSEKSRDTHLSTLVPSLAPATTTKPGDHPLW